MQFEELFDCVKYAICREARVRQQDFDAAAPGVAITLYAMEYLYHRNFLRQELNDRPAAAFALSATDLKQRAVEIQLRIDRRQTIQPGGQFDQYIKWLSESVPITKELGTDFITSLIAAGLDLIVSDFTSTGAWAVAESLYLAVVDYFRTAMLEDAPSAYRSLPSYGFFEAVAEDYELIRQQINE